MSFFNNKLTDSGLNPDLAALKVNPVWHYQMHGKAEQRPYKVQVPRDFDAAVYLQLNPDVQCKMSEADLHYGKHGAKENRRYWLRQGERS